MGCHTVSPATWWVQTLGPWTQRHGETRCWDSGIHMNMKENVIFLQNQIKWYYYIIFQNCPETATVMLAANFEDGWGISKEYGKQEQQIQTTNY